MKGIGQLLIGSMLFITWSCGSEANEEAEPVKIIQNSESQPSIQEQNEPSKKTGANNKFVGMHVVTIRGMKFIPKELTVSKGDTVVWVNEDISIHDVADEKEGRWSSPELERGEYFKYAFNETTEYYCSLHKVMKGKIIVQ